MVLIEPNEKAPAYSMKKEFIDAPVKEVWNILVNISQWPKWNDGVKDVHIAGDVKTGTEFRWISNGMKIRSRIEKVEEPNRIVWSGRTMGIRAVHSWVLAEQGNQTEVSTEESFEGLIVRLLSGQMQKTLDGALGQVLGALKREAEKRHHEAMA
jgi:hypothetical protein